MGPVASRLVSDLLDLARAEGGLPLHRTAVDLATLAAAEVERVRELAPQLRVELDAPAAAVVSADAGRVSQILVNLLDNARRHTPRGGTVSVCVEAGDPCAVVVADTGPGIPEADRQRVFGRLVRLEQARDRDSGGAGLGLPLARALARAHGGDLVAEPSATGARFRLSLPAGEPENGRG